MKLVYSFLSFSDNFSRWRLAFQTDAPVLFQGWADAEAKG
jgi:hypothetical protein